MRSLLFAIILVISSSFLGAQFTIGRPNTDDPNSGNYTPPSVGGGYNPAGAQNNLGRNLKFNRIWIQFIAREVVRASETEFSLPVAYELNVEGNKLQMSAANVFEILAMTVRDWDKNKIFPESIPGVTFNIKGPSFDLKNEPVESEKHREIALLSREILREAPLMLSDAKEMNNILTTAIRFENDQRLTTSQIMYAMAKIIDIAGRDGIIPNTISIYKIGSPSDWNNPSALPIEVIVPTEPIPIIAELFLNRILDTASTEKTIYINDLFITIEIEQGIVKGITGTIDQNNYPDFVVSSGSSPFTFVIDTKTLNDGNHTLKIEIISADIRVDTIEKNIFFSVGNGRISE